MTQRKRSDTSCWCTGMQWKRQKLEVPLRQAGWRVTLGPGELKALKENVPAAMLISLRRLPSHGREVADALWFTKWGRAIPIILFDGLPDKVEATRKKFATAHFTTHAELVGLRATLTPNAALGRGEKRRVS